MSIRVWRRLGLAVAAVLLCSWSGPSAPRAAVPVSQPGVDLGTLGGSQSSAYRVNDSGQVAGSSFVAGGQQHAFLWTGGSGMTDLGTANLPGATEFDVEALSGTGQVAGNTLTSGADADAFSWTAAGGMVDIGTLGGSSSQVVAVNDSGQVAGSSATGSGLGNEHAFIWSQGGPPTDLGTLGGRQSDASGMNQSGQVVGWSYTSGGEVHAFSWTHAGSMVDLGRLPGAPDGYGSQAIAVNDSGEVVGESSTAQGHGDAFLWTQSGGMSDLGTLPGDLGSVGVAVSDNGQVVGESFNSLGQRQAFLWTPSGGMVGLGTLGGAQSFVSGVNDSGVVVGSSITSAGRSHAFAWTQAGGMVDLAPASFSSAAYSVNDHDQVVGDANGRATLWQLAPADLGFVTRQGTQLILDGRPFRPVGLNIYNANSNGLCANAMNATALGSAFAAMGTGANTIRAWFFQPLATNGGARDWSAFDRTLAAAKAHGLKVIATLIDQWGDCGASGPGYGYKEPSWYQSGYKDPDPTGTVSYRDWAAEIAAHYKDDSTILAWQLVNEPEVGDCSTVGEAAAGNLLSSFASDVSGLIKSVDPNHLVSLGTLGSGQCGASGPDYQSVMTVPTLDLCEVHDYTPSQLIPGDQFNGLGLRINQCNALGKPLIVGELGVDPNDVGGTLADRANVVDSKLCAQLSAGVAGVLLWDWDEPGQYDVAPGDPVLGVLAPWSDPNHTCSEPNPPEGLIAAAGDGSATVGWTPPSSTGGSVVISYRVSSVTGGFSTTVAGDQTRAILTGLTNGQSYGFRVIATNAAGSSFSDGQTNVVTPSVGAPTPVVA